MSIKSKKITKVTKANNPSPTPITTLQDDPIVKLVDTMQSIDTKGKEAKKNKTSQDDNNDSRYFYNQWDKIRKDQQDNSDND